MCYYTYKNVENVALSQKCIYFLYEYKVHAGDNSSFGFLGAGYKGCKGDAHSTLNRLLQGQL